MARTLLPILIVSLVEVSFSIKLSRHQLYHVNFATQSWERRRTWRTCGTFSGKEAAANRQLRIHLNAQSYLPWDTPLFEIELRTISKRETRHGMMFVPRGYMAKYDDASERIRSRRSYIMLCFLLHRSHVRPKSTVPSLPVMRMAIYFFFSLLTFCFFLHPKTAHHNPLQPPSSTASYIRHCPHCQMNQTPRHRPYGSLQPIYIPSRPFHTLTIDFIVALPEAATGEDCILTVTDKFSQAVTFIAGKIAEGGEHWARLLLDRLMLLGWGIPWVLISDRDRRFIGQLWEAIFRRLKVDLLYSTAWHPQTDGMSERSK